MRLTIAWTYTTEKNPTSEWFPHSSPAVCPDSFHTHTQTDTQTQKCKRNSLFSVAQSSTKQVTAKAGKYSVNKSSGKLRLFQLETLPKAIWKEPTKYQWQARKEPAKPTHCLVSHPRKERRKRGEFPPGTNTLNSPEHRILAAVFAVILNQYPDQIWQHQASICVLHSPLCKHPRSTAPS